MHLQSPVKSRAHVYETEREREREGGEVNISRDPNQISVKETFLIVQVVKIEELTICIFHKSYSPNTRLQDAD